MRRAWGAERRQSGERRDERVRKNPCSNALKAGSVREEGMDGDRGGVYPVRWIHLVSLTTLPSRHGPRTSGSDRHRHRREPRHRQVHCTGPRPRGVRRSHLCTHRLGPRRSRGGGAGGGGGGARPPHGRDGGGGAGAPRRGDLRPIWAHRYVRGQRGRQPTRELRGAVRRRLGGPDEPELHVTRPREPGGRPAHAGGGGRFDLLHLVHLRAGAGRRRTVPLQHHQIGPHQCEQGDGPGPCPRDPRQ